MANPSYYSPKTQQTAQRSQYLAEALKSLQSNPAPYRTATGTNMNILSDAILQVSKGINDKRLAEGAQADKMRLTDAILGTAPATVEGVENRDLNAPKPFDLTPGATQKRAGEAAMGQTARGIAEMTDPMTALEYVNNQKQMDLENQRYDAEQKYRQSRDAAQDSQWDKGFGLQTDQFGFQRKRAEVQDGQWEKGFNQDASQFGQTMAFNKSQAATNAQLKAAEIAADAAGGAQFDGPQLAARYNKSMEYVDEQSASAARLAKIANSAKSFVEKAKDFGAQGAGVFNDIGQALSMKTSDLNQFTNAIAPLMREVGSGSSSDTDVKMFKESVVSVNNTSAGNQNFARGADLMASRARDYSQFLRESIDPNDIQSLQEAQVYWQVYADENPIFDEETGAPRDPAEIPSFEQWLQSQMGGDEAAAPARAGMQLPADLPPQMAQLLTEDELLAWEDLTPQQKTALANRAQARTNGR